MPFSDVKVCTAIWCMMRCHTANLWFHAFIVVFVWHMLCGRNVSKKVWKGLCLRICHCAKCQRRKSSSILQPAWRTNPFLHYRWPALFLQREVGWPRRPSDRPGWVIEFLSSLQHLEWQHWQGSGSWLKTQVSILLHSVSTKTKSKNIATVSRLCLEGMIRSSLAQVWRESRRTSLSEDHASLRQVWTAPAIKCRDGGWVWPSADPYGCLDQTGLLPFLLIPETGSGRGSTRKYAVAKLSAAESIPCNSWATGISEACRPCISHWGVWHRRGFFVLGHQGSRCFVKVCWDRKVQSSLWSCPPSRGDGIRRSWSCLGCRGGTWKRIGSRISEEAKARRWLNLPLMPSWSKPVVAAKLHGGWKNLESRQRESWANMFQNINQVPRESCDLALNASCTSAFSTLPGEFDLCHILWPMGFVLAGHSKRKKKEAWREELFVDTFLRIRDRISMIWSPCVWGTAVQWWTVWRTFCVCKMRVLTVDWLTEVLVLWGRNPQLWH